jgi:hypothetical protein
VKYVTGVDAAIRSLRQRFDSNMKRNVTIAVRAMAADVLAVSQELVPVETAALKATGAVEETRAANGLLEAKVVYGGPDAPYGLYVHEDMSKYHAPPTCAKFLERAVAEARPRRKEILKRIFESDMGYQKVPVTGDNTPQ